MTTTPKISPHSSIKLDDLLVGENEVMHNSASVWGMLQGMKMPYLRSLIARLEKDDHCDMTEISLPIFKMIYGFATMLQEHTSKDTKLQEALSEAKMRTQMRNMFGPPPEEDE